jgi:hypothetical protein
MVHVVCLDAHNGGSRHPCELPATVLHLGRTRFHLAKHSLVDYRESLFRGVAHRL